MAGIISPSPYLTVVDGNGLPISGALVWTYLGGTATPQATYTDATLGVANTNPIVADSAGRFVAFLTPGANYKYVVETAATPPAHGTVIKTVDGISAPPDSPFSVAIGGTGVATLNAHGVLIGEGTSPIAATGSGTTGQVLTSNGASADPSFQAVPLDNGINDFRLSLTTGLPVTPADVTAATTLYCTPYKGNRIALFDSAGVATIYTSPEFSIAVPATTSQMYDVFCFNNGGTPTLELLQWTNDTTRATALTLATTGVLTKTADLTRRFLGSFRTTTVSGQTEDSATKRYLSNYYNRVRRSLQRYETTASWPYTLATVRQANGSALNQVDMVICVAELLLDLTLAVGENNSTDSVLTSAGIGEDSTTTYAVGVDLTAAAVARVEAAPRLVKYPAVGRHFYSWNEWSTALGTTTWYGAVAAAGSSITHGLSGSIEG